MTVLLQQPQKALQLQVVVDYFQEAHTSLQEALHLQASGVMVVYILLYT